MMPAHTSGGGVQVLITMMVVAVLVLFRLRNLATPRKQALGPGWLLFAPMMALAVTILNFAQQPPRGLEWLWLMAALALGAVLGWWRGKTMQIHVHPVTRAVTSQASPAALLFLVVLVGLRFGLRSIVYGEAQAWHLGLHLIIGIFLVLGLGLLSAQRAEMCLRAERLLTAARRSGETPALEVQSAGEQAVASAPPSSQGKLLLLAGAVFLLILVVGLAIPR